MEANGSSNKYSLSNIKNVNIALGENINNMNDFDFYLSHNNFNYIQPDITKYGGISLIYNLANKYNYEVKCIHLNTSFSIAFKRNRLREENKQVPIIAYSIYSKYYQEPNISEGFILIKI